MHEFYWTTRAARGGFLLRLRRTRYPMLASPPEPDRAPPLRRVLFRSDPQNCRARVCPGHRNVWLLFLTVYAALVTGRFGRGWRFHRLESTKAGSQPLTEPVAGRRRQNGTP